MSMPISRLIVLRDRLETGDDSVLKKTFKELERVVMTFDMLKQSGIGMAVNQLRNHESFGTIARELVAKWKQSALETNSSSSSSSNTNGYYGSNSLQITNNGVSTKHSSSSSYGNKRYSSPSPSPPPPPPVQLSSKKRRLENNEEDDDDRHHHRKSKKDSKSSSASASSSSAKSKSSTKIVVSQAADEVGGGKFTADCGSFEQILGLNDSAPSRPTSASSSSTTKNRDHDREKKKIKSSSDDRSDHRRSEKEKNRSIGADSGYKSSSSSSTASNNVDWSKVLPTKLSTEYRPQPRSTMPIDYDDDPYEQKNGAKNGNESDSEMDFSHLKKTKMTKIYSGRRNIFLKRVPTLFDSCINVLCDNIDALGYTGGVPFDILKPVLERATAAQLYRIEEWNPYLLEDTGDMWKGHCNREFKGMEPDIEEGETWRELYERMLAERDKKLDRLKQVITEQNKAKESALRQAKMSMAKAPREVRRRQIKYGTHRKEAVDAQEAAQSRRNLDSNPGAKTAGRAFSHIYEDEVRAKQEPKHRKEKIAPLMAKSLKMMKLARSRN